MFAKKDIVVPLTVPGNKKNKYIQNYLNCTQSSGNLFIFSGDQKIEHLNKDFHGKDISKDDTSPKHLFEIASKSNIGVFATQLGLITRYGTDYPNVNYVIKANSKTNISKSEPLSSFLYAPHLLEEFITNTKLKITGLGYTIYLGSEYEATMMQEACELTALAHRHGLLSILWMYPRSKDIQNELDADLIAGAAGVGACLGADFIKINPPQNKSGKIDSKLVKQAVLAAGRTKVLCSGGKRIDEKKFLSDLKLQIKNGTCGTATGRNIHQKDLKAAIKFCNKISTIIMGKK